MPIRVQLKRTKGWRIPTNTVNVARPGRFGNPLTIANAIEAGFARDKAEAHPFVVECFREWLLYKNIGREWWSGPKSDACKTRIISGLPSLRGKNLACWCALDKPCHADVLLELANHD